METKSTINHYLKWKNSKESLSLYSLFVQWFMSLGAQMKARLSSLTSATQLHLTGPLVSLSSLRQLIRNKRYVVGVVMLMVALVSYCGHQLFLNMYSEPHDVCRVLGFHDFQCKTWCYVSWYWYWDTIKICTLVIFGTTGMILFVPINKSAAAVPFSIFQGFAWAYLIHYTFFSNSHETINSFPANGILTIGLCLALGVLASSKFLLYWENHKKRGNWQRFAGLAEMDLPAEQKEPLYKQLAQEYRQINKMI